MADQFIIEEQTGSDPIKVVLEKHELPFGRPRRGAAFELGGPVNHEAIFLDGRIPPIIHAKQPGFHPVVIKGHFRDRFDANPGQAWGFVQQLERMRQRMRPLKLTWWQLTWMAFMDDGKFPVEGSSDFTYEMKFRILVGPGTQQNSDASDRKLLGMTASPADLTAQVRAMLAEDRVRMIGFVLMHTAATALDAAFANVDAALSNVEDAAAAFENAPARADAEAKGLIGKAEEAKQRCDDIQTIADSFSATATANALSDVANSSAAALGTVLTTSTADAQNAYWAWLTQTILDMDTTRDALRTMQFTARQRINAASRIYVVADGDTLERIAEVTLGSATRAHELGYRPTDIKSGKKLRIPVRT
jgi:nucleoid-associated protein YgaU